METRKTHPRKLIRSFLDLHAHFPMHFDPPKTGNKKDDDRNRKLLELANKLNFFRKPRVDLDKARRGGLRGLASVLYNPQDEFCNPCKPFKNLLTQADCVEKEVAKNKNFVMVRTGNELSKVLASEKKIAVFHCVEGAHAIESRSNVKELAKKGVAYVVLAHLLYRGIAKNVNPFPCLDDESYEGLFYQPRYGLSVLGKEICEELFCNRILVDITHCHPKAIDDVFQIAYRYPGQPVITSHTAAYCLNPALINVNDKNIIRIRDRGGVIGIIFYEHWLKIKGSSLSGITLLFKHIDHVAKICGSCDNIAIGSDLDGFIKPVKGLKDLLRARHFAECLTKEYGEEVAEKILWKNACRVLEQGWG